MHDTLDTQLMRERVLEILDAQGLDAHTRMEKGEEVARMTYVDLVTTFPQLQTG